MCLGIVFQYCVLLQRVFSDIGYLCKDSAQRHPQFRRRRFLKVFTMYGHGSHLVQWTIITADKALLFSNQTVWLFFVLISP